MKTRCRAITSLSILYIFAFLLLNSVVVADDLTSGLIAYYPFNGNANDESGHGNNGVIHGAILATDKCGNPDSAYFFNRTDSAWIEVPHNGIQNTPVDAGLTLSLWINPYDISDQALMGKQPSGSCATYHSSTTSNHGGLFDLDLTAGQPYFASQFESSCGTEGYVGQTQPLEVHTWHHIVITVDVTDKTKELVKFYTNGQLADSHYYDQYSSPILSQPSTEPIRIGKRKDSDFGYPAYFWGTMDDIRIYNRPLADSEVLELYEQYQGNECQIPATTEALTKGLILQGASCVNLTTGQRVRVLLNPDQTSVNCAELGLKVNPGDQISIGLLGLVSETN